MATKRKDLSLTDKIKLLRELQSTPGMTQVAVAQKFGVSTSQVSRLVQQKESLLKAHESGDCRQQKRVRLGKDAMVDKALLLWLHQKTSQGSRISGPILKEKAMEIATTKGVEFSPSDGWLDRWKKGTMWCTKDNTVKSSPPMALVRPRGLKTVFPAFLNPPIKTIFLMLT